MNFNDKLIHSLAKYPGIFPHRSAVLDHFFCTNGTGIRWSDSDLAESHQGPMEAELCSILQYISEGKHKEPPENLEYIPKELRRLFLPVEIPADIEERAMSTPFTNWYPMSDGYQGHPEPFHNLYVPETGVAPDILNAVWETCNLILAQPLDWELDRHCSPYVHHQKGTSAEKMEKARRQLLETRKHNRAIATRGLERLLKFYPDHQFQQNPPPVIDGTRTPPKFDGKTPLVYDWPIDGSPTNLFSTNIIEPFSDAIKFIYRLSRKKWKGEGGEIVKYRDIPYCGLNIGDDDRAGCLGPEERFTAESLEYDEVDQGRKPLQVILGVMAQVCIEQGRRMAREDIAKTMNHHFRHLATLEEIRQNRAELEERAKTDSAVVEPVAEAVPDEAEGIKAVIALQSMAGQVETEDQARAGWGKMSDSERQTTLEVYAAMKSAGAVQ